MGSQRRLCLSDFNRVPQLQFSFAESVSNTIEGFEQAILFLILLRLIKEISLHCLFLLPIADTLPDEPHGFPGESAMKKERPGFTQDDALVMGINGELVLAGVGLEVRETDLQGDDRSGQLFPACCGRDLGSQFT